MPQLGLRIASNHLPIPTQWQPPLLLFFVTEGSNVGNEHDPVQRSGQVVAEGLNQHRKVRRQDNLTARLVTDAQLPTEFNESYMLGQCPRVPFGPVQVGVVRIVKDPRRIAFNELLEAATSGRLGRTAVDQVREDFWVKGSPGAFALEVGVDGHGGAGCDS